MKAFQSVPWGKFLYLIRSPQEACRFDVTAFHMKLMPKTGTWSSDVTFAFP